MFAVLIGRQQRTTRPIGAKSRELIDSAIQSRAASRAASEAGGPPATLSRPMTPFGSSDHLPSLASSEATGSTSAHFVNTPDDDDLYGSTYTQDRYPRMPDARFTGMFPRASGGSLANSDNEAEAGSLNNSDAEDSPFGDPVEADETVISGLDATLEDEVVDVSLDDAAPPKYTGTLDDIQ